MSRPATEDLYLSVQDDQDDAAKRLRKLTDPAERAVQLDRLAEYDQYQAGLHTQTFGPDPIEEEGGRDMAESLVLSAAVYRAVAAAERAQATGHSRGWTTDVIEHAAGQVLDKLAATPGHLLDERAEIFEDLYAALEPVVGGQAAEVVATSMSHVYNV